MKKIIIPLFVIIALTSALAGAYIELSAVTRTGNHVTRLFALSQRTAVVGADIVDGAVFAVNIKDGDPAFANLNDNGRVTRL